MYRRMDGKALASLLLGLLSLGGCTGPFAGLPAIVLGAMARRDIDRAQGALTGRGLATGGIFTGLLGTGIGAVLFLLVVRAAVTPVSPQTTAEVKPIEPPAVLGSAAPPAPPPARAAAPARNASLSGVRSYGSLEVVDLDHSRPLQAQLSDAMHHAQGRTVILQTYLSSNAACAAVAAALPDRRTQGALANVVLVRVDAREYSAELRRMNVETRRAPWFYKLDAKGQPADAMSGDAWASKAPDTIAPALGRFVHRAGPARRPHR